MRCFMKKVTDASFIEIAQIAAIAGREAVAKSKAKKQTQVISQNGFIVRVLPIGDQEVLKKLGA